MKVKVHISCPYCGNDVLTQLDVESHQFIQDLFVYCYPEDNGCDRQFAIQFVLKPTVTNIFELVSAN